MIDWIMHYSKKTLYIIATIIYFFSSSAAVSESKYSLESGNFGLPGIIDLPTAYKLPDGELVVTQQIHNSLSRIGISFQALPRLGFSFRYTGHGSDGSEAYGRVNHDRSFDAHITILDEGAYNPAISVGLRDFIGTGWYSSEYIVASKSIGRFEFTTGLGFGRLVGEKKISNPLSVLSSRFENRAANNKGRGGTLGTINWFSGSTSLFYGLTYDLGRGATLSAEYTPDKMSQEAKYLDIESSWNIGASYKLNEYITLSTQYLHGSELSFTANVAVNPARPPLIGGKELAPVPMRLRNLNLIPTPTNNVATIRKVLEFDEFTIKNLSIKNNIVKIEITNNKFRSTAQAIGRIASTLQRFTADDIKFAEITFNKDNLKTGSYRIDLDNVTREQFGIPVNNKNSPTVSAFDPDETGAIPIENKFTWGIGPYISQRLFNPDLPLSLETGVEFAVDYKLFPELKVSGSVRKSILTNLTDNKRRSNSVLPRVHSDWPLYDFAGQPGHIHELTISYLRNLAPGLYGRFHAGLLEPFFAGFGGEVLYKPINSPFGIGLDIHRVRKRDYDMLFDLLEYQETIGHLSVYYDAGEMFNIEINAGKYLAGDWGATTTISRKFGSGWEVGGYATLTDVPFATFGEGSFDKAIYVSIPIDWIISKPIKTRRVLTLRPITRDGGANLASSRKLYSHVKDTQSSQFYRESGRLWK